MKKQDRLSVLHSIYSVVDSENKGNVHVDDVALAMLI